MTIRIIQVDDDYINNIANERLIKKLGISLGGVNYCLKALIKIGHIKVNNFQKNPNKSAYLYLLTPSGISEKAALTTDFLKRKMVEYEMLKNGYSIRRSSVTTLLNSMNGIPIPL
jgi:EPS-associated MarR family transcriptional regulator